MTPNRTRFYLVGMSVLVGLLATMLFAFSGVPVTATPNPPKFGSPELFSNSLTPTAPTFGTFAGQSVIEISYTSHLNVSETFVIYGVFHDSLGQVIFMTTATATIQASGNQTAYLVTSLLPAGNFRATIFATTETGVVVSPVSTTNVQVT